MDAIKKVKLDKLLLILVLVFICLYNFLSYFNSSWEKNGDSIHQLRNSSLIINLCISGALFCLVALVFLLFINKKYPLKISLPIISLTCFGIFWSIYAVLIDKVSIFVLLRDSFPPISLIAAGIMLAGYNNEFWKIIKKMIFLIACIFTLFSFYEIIIAFIKFGFEYRITYGAPMYLFEIGLFATYGLVILTDEWKNNKKILVLILIILLFFNSAILQGRSWFLQTCFLFIIYIFNIKNILKNHKVLSILVPLSIVGVTSIIFINNIDLFEGLINRFSNSGDTRTSQLEQFFNQVSIDKLLIGQGTKASYTYSRYETFNFIDNQVLLFMFRYGIIPTISYCFIVIYPIVKSLMMKNIKLFYKSITMIVWFAAMMGVSVYFNISFGTMSIIIMLYCGRLFYEIDNYNSTNLSTGV